MIRSAVQFQDRFAAEGRFKRLMRGFRVKGTEWFHIHPDDANATLVKIKDKENY